MHENRLLHETSPYLRQHAHNPVDWYPWGEEALIKAEEENKPILVSIGYSACHWCHVMERESFEDQSTAAIMNENFVNIKIDREERPDLDHIYMDAVQAMTGSGGWPLNVFLTPDRKPFYGGTYFPPVNAYNRPSWKEVLVSIAAAFKNRRHEIDAQAENLTAHLLQSNSFGLSATKDDSLFSKVTLDDLFYNIMKSADRKWGGFGRAPKFPQTYTVKYLLRHYHFTKNEEALEQALLTLDKMINGGIYDQAGGGFARYSTDAEWLVPHFEKMLYDNALLISVLSEAFQLTGIARYKEVIDQTIVFLKREMLHPDGAFYAALDADSEGVEGKFYVWSYAEVSDLLQENAPLFCAFFNITEEGNWEGANILWRPMEKDAFCSGNNLPVNQLEEILEGGISRLLKVREKRVRPQLDDKILLNWNALAISSLCKAGAATGNNEYIQLAERCVYFLLTHFKNRETDGLFHSWKEGSSKYPAFLDDYAFLIEALIDLQEVTGNINYLEQAKDLTRYVTGNFSEGLTGFFYYTAKDQQDVIVRKKEVYDGAQPSGNAVMLRNLYRLAKYYDLNDYMDLVLKATRSLGNAIVKYPVSFGYWACLLQELVTGTFEIAVTGKNALDELIKLNRLYIPNKIIMCNSSLNNDYPLLMGKRAETQTLFYLCKDYSCKKPVNSIDELKLLLSENDVNNYPKTQ